MDRGARAGRRASRHGPARCPARPGAGRPARDRPGRQRGGRTGHHLRACRFPRRDAARSPCRRACARSAPCPRRTARGPAGARQRRVDRPDRDGAHPSRHRPGQRRMAALGRSARPCQPASAPRCRCRGPRAPEYCPGAQPCASAVPARCPVRHGGAPHPGRRHRVRGARGIRGRHGPPPHRLEVLRAPRPPLRQGIRDRAQQPDRLRVRLRTDDVRAHCGPPPH